MKHVIIVIITYNNEDSIIPCISSVARLTGITFDLLVIDNASADGTLKKVRGFLKKNPVLAGKTRIVENAENVGFAKSVNIGLRHALERDTYYAVQLFNPDISVGRNAVSAGIRVLEKHPDVGAGSAHVLYPDRTVWWAGTRLFSDRELAFGMTFGVAEHTGKGRILPAGAADAVRDTDAVSGCAMLIRTDAVRQVGLFNEKYYMYMEDIDYSLRLKRAGWRVVSFPDASVIHHTEDKKVYVSTTASKQLRKYRIYITSAMLYLFEYRPLAGMLWLLKTPYILARTYRRRKA